MYPWRRSLPRRLYCELNSLWKYRITKGAGFGWPPLRLCYSQRFFVMAFPRESHEAFFAGHVAAFQELHRDIDTYVLHTCGLSQKNRQQIEKTVIDLLGSSQGPKRCNIIRRRRQLICVDSEGSFGLG